MSFENVSGKCRYSIIILLVLALAGFFAVWLIHESDAWPGKIRNVLLISIDTCRADRLSCYGYKRPTTPNIDAVAAEGILFENVISPIPTTLPAHSSMLTGTIPPYHGIHSNFSHPLDNRNITLAEILKDAGFTTGAVVSAFVLDSGFGLSQGFDAYHDRFEPPLAAHMRGQRPGGETTGVALKWLEENKDKRFFLFLHYFDPHGRYRPPEPFASKFGARSYAGEIAYTDHCIGQVVQKLKDLRLYDSTLLIVTSDHGEMLGEHGEGGHEYFIYQAAIKVPLIFKLPGQKQAARIESIAGLIDIVPTVCGLLNVEAPKSIQGIDLSPSFRGEDLSVRERHLFCESFTATRYGGNSLLGILNDRFKYIQTTRPELYDLIMNPAESNNLFAKQQQRSKIMKGKLAQMLEESVRRSLGDNRIELDSQAIEQLQSLGYVGGAVTEEFSFDQTKDDPKDLLEYHHLFWRTHFHLLEKDYDKANMYAEEMIRQRPEWSSGYERLGRTALAQKDYCKAIVYLQKAIEREPNNARIYNKRAMAYTGMGEYEKAIRDLNKAIELRPRYIEAYNNRGVAYLRKGDCGEALREFKKVIELNAGDVFARQQMARALMRLGRSREALRHFRQALAMQADRPWVLINLARILATDKDAKIRDGAEAVRFAERASQLLDYKSSVALSTLAAAYAEAGQFDQAVETAERAVQVARDSGEEEVANNVERHLELYRARRARRE